MCILYLIVDLSITPKQILEHGATWHRPSPPAGPQWAPQHFCHVVDLYHVAPCGRCDIVVPDCWVAGPRPEYHAALQRASQVACPPVAVAPSRSRLACCGQIERSFSSLSSWSVNLLKHDHKCNISFTRKTNICTHRQALITVPKLLLFSNLLWMWKSQTPKIMVRRNNAKGRKTFYMKK